MLNSLIVEYALPEGFLSQAEQFYLPVAHEIAQRAKPGCLFFGIQGCQGSGKSTAAEFLKVILESQFSKRVAVASIDDFYLGKYARKTLANDVHPLFVTRGVPATHDLVLINEVFNALTLGESARIPRFDKANDDRLPESQWQIIEHQVDVFILEGWCVGVSAQADSELEMPVNQLESREDPDGLWRKTVNGFLKKGYAEIFNRLDLLLALQAPSFNCVYEWRLLQEQRLIQRLEAQGLDASGAQTAAELRRFIAHYQRLTEHALRTMPSQANWLITLNNDHSFSKLLSKNPL